MPTDRPNPAFNQAESFTFNEQKTMYGGKHIAKGDMISIFASDNEGGSGLLASGIVTSAEATPKKSGVARATNKIAGISDAAVEFLSGFF